MKFPKIETLYNRDLKTFKVKTGELRLPEFGLINQWLITEKVDGTNIRVALEPSGQVRFGGRTDRAQIPTFLLDTLQDMFPPEKMQAAFERDGEEWPQVVLYGEGYGVKIQKGGKYRDSGTSFRLFDVRVGEWWLNWENVLDIAEKLEISTVPWYSEPLTSFPVDVRGLNSFFPEGSLVALQEKKEMDVQPEGIVARTDPLLFTRRGQRVMWKLKLKDF